MWSITVSHEPLTLQPLDKEIESLYQCYTEKNLSVQWVVNTTYPHHEELTCGGITHRT